MRMTLVRMNVNVQQVFFFFFYMCSTVAQRSTRLMISQMNGLCD